MKDMTDKRYSGDFMYYSCPNCYRQTRVTIKDEELQVYFCAYCGIELENKEAKE